jgi:uncharacterized protein (AIM24 family)
MDAGERLGAASGSMISRSSSVRTVTATGDGGVVDAPGRELSDERAVPATTFEADADGSSLTLAPDRPGDVHRIDLSETGPVTVRPDDLLAWTDGVEQSVGLGASAHSPGTSLALDGTGTAFLSASGCVRRYDVSSGDPLVVDGDHLLAWTDGLGVARGRDTSLRSGVPSDEGLVTAFSGDGRVWLQTRDGDPHASND